MRVDLKELQEQFKKAWEELKKLIEAQAGEIKNHGETSQKTATAIATAEKRLQEIGEEFSEDLRHARFVMAPVAAQ